MPNVLVDGIAKLGELWYRARVVIRKEILGE
jgi:hypothetical protein